MLVKEFLPDIILSNEYYTTQKIAQHFNDAVLNVYQATKENRKEYPFSLFNHKYITTVLETGKKLIGINKNPLMGWSFPIKNKVSSYNTENLYKINGEYAVYMHFKSNCMVFMFIKERRQKAIESSEILKLKKENKFTQCTELEKLEILYQM